MKSLFKLLKGVLVLFFVIGLLIFVKKKVPAYQIIEEQGLETDALFYSESPEAVERNFQMMQKM